MREWRYVENGLSLRLDLGACTGCGACVDVCPHAAFEIADRKARIRDRSLCMECGACARNCPASALKVAAGVGCAMAIINGKLRGTAPSCDCASGKGRGAGDASCC
jgi:NAD-dependent dihydropyrimidine dehydrogenase PreA subunit